MSLARCDSHSSFASGSESKRLPCQHSHKLLHYSGIKPDGPPMSLEQRLKAQEALTRELQLAVRELSQRLRKYEQKFKTEIQRQAELTQRELEARVSSASSIQRHNLDKDLL